MIKVKCLMCGLEVSCFLSSITCKCNRLLSVYEEDSYVVIKSDNLLEMVIIEGDTVRYPNMN